MFINIPRAPSPLGLEGKGVAEQATDEGVPCPAAPSVGATIGRPRILAFPLEAEGEGVAEQATNEGVPCPAVPSVGANLLIARHSLRSFRNFDPKNACVLCRFACEPWAAYSGKALFPALPAGFAFSPFAVPEIARHSLRSFRNFDRGNSGKALFPALPAGFAFPSRTARSYVFLLNISSPAICSSRCSRSSSLL